jgi:sarcosine oxidase subunit beta
MLYLRPEGAQQMFVGWREGDRIHGVEDLIHEDPDHYKQTSHYASLKRMEEGLIGLLPFMRNGFAHRTYACVYDYTPDAMPILDRVDEVEGLYFALGYSGGGFSISPWVGRMMAQFIHDGARPEGLELVSLERFTSGRLIDWSNIKPAAKARAEA